MVNTAKLKGKLRELSKTQADLARFIGVAQATMCQKLNNERPIYLDEAEKIAKFLEISDSEFGSYFFR